MKLESRRVVIIGAGHVGSHVGYALAALGLTDEIVFIDLDEPKARAQAFDISDATCYLTHSVKSVHGDYSLAKDADLIVISAGPFPDRFSAQKQSRMDTLGQTLEAIDDIVPKIKQSGFSGFILSISNPADVIANYMQIKLAYPAHKILSTSTTLDSSRLRRKLSERFGIDRKSINAYYLGEHGESHMIPWSLVNIAGKSLFQLIKEGKKPYADLDLEALKAEASYAGWNVAEGKGSTEFGIGTSAAEIVRAIFGNEKRVLPVSVMLQGEYGQKGVYASVPAVLGNKGVEQIIELDLTPKELEQFAASCNAIRASLSKALEVSTI
jgi:L-lactate dehydrogenase